MAQALHTAKLGSLQVTAASQALYTYRHSFLCDTLFCHTEPDTLNLEEQAYVGGRCEAWQLGEHHQPIYHLDYSSLYAACCQREAVPIRLIGTDKNGETGPMPKGLEGKCRIAEVTVRTDEPVFPYKGRELTYYPVGTFKTTLCEPELQYAEANKLVVAYHKCAWYEAAPVLAHYADYWLNARRYFRANGMNDLENWTKRMLVSLPGKFGQRGRDWVDSTTDQEIPPYHSWKRKNKEGKWERWRSIAWHIQKEVCSQWANNAIPAIAAHICSSGRMELWRAMKVAGLENVIYVDTDSVTTNGLGYSRLSGERGLIGQDPGQLRLLWTGNWCDIRGWKDYTVGPNTRRSGIPKGQSGDGITSSTVWVRRGMDEACRNGERPAAARQLVTVRNNRKYKHGCVQDDGFVTPWNLPEDAYRCQ